MRLTISVNDAQYPRFAAWLAAQPQGQRSRMLCDLAEGALDGQMTPAQVMAELRALLAGHGEPVADARVERLVDELFK